MTDIAAFLEFIQNRKTIRSFNNQDIEDQIILEVLEAGRWSPSVQNSQPWEFIVIKDQEVKNKVASVAEHAPTISKAPIMIAVIKNMEKEDQWLASQLAYEQSVSCSGMLMLLAIHTLGLGGYWVNVDRVKCGEVLGVPKEKGDVAYVIGFGYVDTDKEARLFFPTPDNKRRKSIIQSTHFNKYGQIIDLPA